MINKELRQRLREYAKSLDIDIRIFSDPSFDNSIIGLTNDYRLIYDYEKMVEELMEDIDISIEDATDYVEYDVIRSLSYIEDPEIIMFRKIDDI